MSLLEHLEELRSRIIVIFIAVLVAACRRPFPRRPDHRALRSRSRRAGPSSSRPAWARRSASRIQLALMTGVALAMPVILYEIWAFVTPGLTRPERRLVWPLLIAAVIFFAAGIPRLRPHPARRGLPPRLLAEGVEPLIGLGDYIGFVTLFLLAFGSPSSSRSSSPLAPPASSATPSSRAGVDT